MLVFFEETDCHEGVMGTRAKKQNGFVLMDFLIVMAVMGIFGSIIFSFGKRVLDRAYLFADKTRLYYLVTQYMSAVDNGLDLTNVKNTVDFAYEWENQNVMILEGS